MNPPERLLLFACVAYVFVDAIGNLIDWLVSPPRG